MDLVIGETAADEDTDVCSSHTFLGHARALESLECTFEKKALLRIKCSGLLHSHVEERGIKTSRILLEEVTALCVDASLFARSGMVVCIFGVACRGSRTPAGTASGAQLPQLLWRRNIAR